MADKTAHVLGCTEEEYFADPCEVPSLSQSIAHTLITKTPYHAWLEHPRLGGVGRPPTKAKDRGTLVHSALLGAGRELAVIVADDYRTKAAREQRDAARAEGLLPVLKKDAEGLLKVISDLRSALLQKGIRLKGASEVAVTWEEETTAGPVVCRGLFDHVLMDQGVIYDLKTCRSAHEKAITSHVIEYGYDIQRAAYMSALRKLRGKVTGREDFVFLFVEELPEESPVRVIVHPVQLSGVFRQLGEMKWERACETWARCRRDDKWPAYHEGNRPTQIEPPGWALPAELVA